MRNQKRDQNAIEYGSSYVSQYTKPKKIQNFEIEDRTPLLNKIKRANPSMQVNVVHHNGIFAVVVHFENNCFCYCHWCLQEADASIALGILRIQKEFKTFVEPDNIF